MRITRAFAITGLSAAASYACASGTIGGGPLSSTAANGSESTSTSIYSSGSRSSSTTSSAGASTSQGTSAVAAGDAGAGASCVASCTGHTCGDDGCGGTCGSCPPSQMCTASGTCAAPTASSAIVVDARSQLTPISPAIYGVALNSDDSVGVASLNRWGGDATSSYNWKTDLYNSGNDWNCANYKGGPFTSPTPSATLSNGADQFVQYNASKHLDTLMTIPISGWVANQETANTSLSACAGGTQDQTCCKKIGSSQSVQVDKGSAQLDPSFMGDWVKHLVSTFGNAASGGVKYYQLDNEPDNWQALRQDIYPTLYPPGTFCEPFYDTITTVGTSINQDFINRTMTYAKAVKAADPTATLLFMSMESPNDLVSLNGVECAGSGSMYSMSSSLAQSILALAAQEQAATHQRLLDCIDMHYPVSGPALTATSAIWDATTSSVFPHVQQWINATYPGTGICVSEYNWGNDGTNGSAPDTTTGTLEADLLGMFGRFGVRLASYWTTLVSKSTHLPVYNAMAMYRNYDGQGGRFGSVSVGAASSNSGVHAFAATDSATAPTKLWVMLVNVSGKDQSGLSVAVQNFGSAGSAGSTAKVFQMTNGGAPAAGASVPVTGGAVSGLSLPSGAVTLLVLGS